MAAAVLASLALAMLAWLHPDHPALLGLVAATMFCFAVLDAREVAHQIHIDKNGLGILAALVAVLHLAAAAVATSMAMRARRMQNEVDGRAGTMTT